MERTPLHLRHMDSFPAMSLGRFAKNLDDCESSTTFSQASLDNQLNGFLLTCGSNHGSEFNVLLSAAGCSFDQSLRKASC